MFAGYCTTQTKKCHNITRFGNAGDGGYEGKDRILCVLSQVCMSPPYNPQPNNCIVYSFGIGHNWNFDDAARKYICDMHSFDPCINKQDHERAPMVVIAGDGSGDKLPLQIKCLQWLASPTVSDNQVRLLAYSCWVATKPGGTASTDRRRDKSGLLPL